MEFIKSKILKHPNLKHAFCLRSGGVSPHPYKSLNCSYYVGDQNINVKKNHELILKSLNFEKSFSVKQVHSNKVVCAEDHLSKNTEIEADAIICKSFDLAISVTTADCAPLLIFDRKELIVGAAHAGWKGAVKGITDNLIEHFQMNGSLIENILVAIGPCIGKDSFEVKSDMIKACIKEDYLSERFFINKSNSDFFDLGGYLVKKLENKGLKFIDHIDEDTYKNSEKFFSYRRETKKNNPTTGRMINIIGLTK